MLQSEKYMVKILLGSGIKSHQNVWFTTAIVNTSPLLPNYARQSFKHICAPFPKYLSSNKSFIPFNEIEDDREIRFYDTKHELQIMTFGALKTFAAQQRNEKGRDLIRLTVSGDKSGQLKPDPTFRCLLPSELAELVRKNRYYKKGQNFEKIPLADYGAISEGSDINQGDSSANTATINSGRIKQKQVALKVGVGDHDIQVAADKIRKWLKGGRTFVIVNIAASSNKNDGILLEANLRGKLNGVEEINNLTFKL